MHNVIHFLFEIIDVVLHEAKSEGWPGPNLLLLITASVADAAVVNPNGIKRLLANGLITLFIKSSPVFTNGSKSLPKNPPYLWVLDNFISAEQLFSKTLRSFETCVLVNNSLFSFFIIRITNNTWWNFQSYLSTIFYS